MTWPDAPGSDEADARLVALAMLLAKGPVSLQEIRELMPREYAGSSAATRKKFQRDKDALEMIGLRVAAGNDHYWLDTPGIGCRRALTSEERFAIADAVAAVADAVDPEVHRLASIGALKLRTGDADPMATADSISPGADAIVVTFDHALRTGYPLSFDYTTTSGAVSRRVVHPWAVAVRGDVWVVLGWDDTRDAPRHFRIDGVATESVRRVDATFRRPPDAEWLATHFGAAPWQWGDGPEVDVAVLLAGAAPPGPDELPPGSRIETTENGRFGFRLTVNVRNPDPLLNWVLRHGRDARLDSPGELVARLRHRLQESIRTLDAAPPDLDPVEFSTPTEDRPATMPPTPTLKPSARRAGRILQLLSLASGEQVERSRLADLIGCSEAELEEDLARLFNHCYLPPDTGGNWFDVEPDAERVRIVGPDPGNVADLSDFEAIALGVCVRVYLATHPASPSEERTLRNALDAVGLSPPDVGERPAGEADFAVFVAVAEALRSSRRIRFVYVTDGPAIEREVDPQQLSISAGHRYMTGWDHLRRAQRAFRIDRMTAVEVTGTTFDPGALPPLPSRSNGDPGFLPVGDRTISVLVPPSWARWAERRFGPSAVRHGATRSLLTLRSNDPGRYAATLLSMLPACTLVGPPDARTAVADLARAILLDLPERR